VGRPQTEPLRTGLEDAHPYVRRTAVMGVLKVHCVDADMVERLALLEPLRVSALNDPDPQVSLARSAAFSVKSVKTSHRVSRLRDLGALK
jgi:vesicle coat complex subunit